MSTQSSSQNDDWFLQKGPRCGRLVMRVLKPSVKAEYQSLKPGCSLDPNQLLPRSGPLHCPPWSSSAKIIVCQDEDKLREPFSEDGEQSIVSVGSDETIFDLYLFELRNGQILEVHQTHLSRKSNEEFHRLLKRLEISMSKKLGNVASKQNKKQKRMKQASLVISSSELWARTLESSINTASPLGGFKPWSVENLSHIGLSDRVLRDSLDIAVTVSLTATKHAPIPIEVDVCPPTVVAVKTFENFEASVFVGVPLVITCEVMYGSHVIVDWYVEGTKAYGDSACYTPVQEDIGKEIAVLITPTRHNHNGQGYEEAYRFKNVVEPLPRMAILSPLREEWMHRRSSTKFLRVVTYNILADQNAYSRNRGVQSIYPYCDLKFLARSRRMPMIVYEILSYQSDVVCLQEVDMGMYESIFKPVLRAKGYQGYYSVKRTGSTREGCAMFWSLRCFERVLEAEMCTHVIRDIFPEPIGGSDRDSDRDSTSTNGTWESMHAIGKLLYEYENLRDVIQNKLGHVLQVATLTFKKDPCKDNVTKKMVLANTHLFFHPNAGHIRLMQLLVSCHLLDSVRKEHTKKWPLVFCGDFNSTIQSGSSKLMYEGTVPPNHNQGHTWDYLQSFAWERDQRKATSVIKEKDTEKELPTLSLPPEFPRLCSALGSTPPQFTHYISGFQGVLDHILVSESSEQEPYGFRPKQSAAMPTEKDITMYVAMPNEFMPSDHIALVCDVELVSHKEGLGINH